MHDTITETVVIPAQPEVVFAAMVDWDTQGSWMLGTTVKAGVLDGHGVGGTIEAFSGAGRFGVLDTMTITAWEPPYRCAVEHTGTFIKGTGLFAVLPHADGAIFEWSEQFIIPFGFIGAAGWTIVRPLFVLAVRISLRRFARSLAN